MDFGLWINSIKTSLTALSSIQGNEVLRERIAFIYEQMDVMEKTHATTQNELSEAKTKIVELENEIAAYRAKEQFINHDGALFRKEPSGNYIRAVYCPNCLIQVGYTFPDFPFICDRCKWSSHFTGNNFSSVFNSLPK